MDISTLEKFVSAFNENDGAKILKLVEDEAQKLKERGHIKAANRAERISQRIQKRPAGHFVGQSLLAGSPNSELFEEIKPTHLLSNTVLNAKNRATIKEVVTGWERRDELIANGVYPNNKILLYGPPGTGKTHLANALANELGMPLILIRLDEIISSYLGNTGKNIRKIFDLAKSSSVIILLDEFDTIAKYRDDSKEMGELKRVVTVLLQNIDIFDEKSILIAATNHPELLDNAIWRRFPTKIAFDLPEEPARKALFEVFLQNSKIKTDVDYNFLAKITNKFSGADIEECCKKAKRTVILEGRNKILTSDFIEQLFKSYSHSHQNGQSRKDLFKASKILLERGYKLAEIADLTEIPYSTLRDNTKAK